MNNSDFDFIINSMYNGLYNQAINRYRYMSKQKKYKFYLHCKKNTLHIDYFNRILMYM
jgi:hypothetical protein